jgi:hypothetical protein
MSEACQILVGYRRLFVITLSNDGQIVVKLTSDDDNILEASPAGPKFSWFLSRQEPQILIRTD